MSKQYRIELGFDWNSSPITGSEILTESMSSPQLVYPLQIALTDSTGGGSPAFFTGFSGGDQLNFWLFDITDILNGTQPWDITGYKVDPSQGLTVVFQQGGTNADPFTSANTWDIAPQGSSVSTSWAFSTTGQTFGYAPVNAIVNGKSEDWATLAGHSAPVTYELSLKLVVSLGGQTKTFVTDPELIVGDSSGPD